MAQKVSGIGVWEDILQIISVIGVLVNCALLGFLSNRLDSVLGPVSDGVLSALILLLYEHGILFFKYWFGAYQ